MKEHGIIMSGHNPKLILDGRKTQTRRIVDLSAKKVLTKEQRKIGFQFFPQIARVGDYSWVPSMAGREDEAAKLKLDQHLLVPARHTEDSHIAPEDCGCSRLFCQYGAAGERLWVRENWRTRKEWDKCKPTGFPISVTGDGFDVTDREDWPEMREQLIHYAVAPENNGKLHGKLRPSIFMPRWASRITLEITKVRVERLQDINGEDVIAEGVTNTRHGSDGGADLPSILDYHLLWDSLHGKDAWQANPWVWVIEFQRIQDVDALTGTADDSHPIVSGL